MHLLHQEMGRHGGVIVGIDGRAVQLAQIAGPLQWILEPLVGLVDAHRPLHGQALGGRALRRKLVGVRLTLQGFPAGIKRSAVLRKLHGNTKKFVVVGLKIHVSKKPPARSVLAAQQWLRTGAKKYQTRKLSPQPQRSRSFGLMNLKPSFKPSRTKSSWVPSM